MVEVKSSTLSLNERLPDTAKRLTAGATASREENKKAELKNKFKNGRGRC
jgi:hypothetical protein